MKYRIAVFFAAFVFFALPLHASGNTDTGRYSLEDAVQAAAIDISGRITNGTIAVVKIFTSSDNLSLQAIRWLENGLVESGKLTIISRQQINAVLNEQEFGLSGYVDDESARRIGHIVGAEYVLSGEIIIVNGMSILNIQVIETETAMLVYSNSFQIKDKQEDAARNKQYRF
ncbi:MAG: CsgG/HfaB family protein [Treponema sp.]|nr:CsgG/HfaB family protein [Treponema sp.]